MDEQVQKQGKAPRKQQQRSLVTQQKLLGAAIAAFAENGFKGTSTRDIAERAGVHHPLITYHFKNKEQLWQAAAEMIFNDLLATLEKARAGQDNAHDRVESVIRAYVHHSHEQPAVHNFVIQESNNANPRLDWLIGTYMRPLFNDFIDDFRELQRRGIAPEGDPGILFSMIRVAAGGLVSRLLVARRANDIDFDAPAAMQELSDTIVRVFLPGATRN